MASGRLTGGEAADQMQNFVGNPAAAANAVLGAAAAPGVGYKWTVYGYLISGTGGANTVVIASAANAKTPVLGVAANGLVFIPPNPDVPLFDCNENEALSSTLTAATAVGLQVWAIKTRV